MREKEVMVIWLQEKVKIRKGLMEKLFIEMDFLIVWMKLEKEEKIRGGIYKRWFSLICYELDF